MKSILVLGHRGMLGHVVQRYFVHMGCLVSTLRTRFEVGCTEPFFQEIASIDPEVVINCIGAIKQKASSEYSMYETNGILPWVLRMKLPAGVLLVHPSTDCLFMGTRGQYFAHEKPDATDTYGLSKAIGEGIQAFRNTLVVRCSLIGPELGHPARGLLGWFLGQPRGAIVQGYIDHHWNGITTLEWAKVVSEKVKQWRYLGLDSDMPLLQPGLLEPHSKYEMLCMFRERWCLNIDVLPHRTGQPVDRTLVPNYVCKPLSEQLRELRDWYEATQC